MTVAEAIDYINAHTWSQWKLGLSRTEELLRLVGEPQKRLRFVHVAGSNGKGSTCAMLERILREAGYVTGFYPSPYIEDFRERIQVCGEYITEEALCRITARVRDAADSMEDHPSQFELITAIGMLYFEEKHCDIVVLEVGLGGTFDSTNVIDAPEAAVITNIGLEHTDYLGNTLAEIAGNKCGIIKAGADVVCYENDPEVMEVVFRVCSEKGCPLHIASFGRIQPLQKGLDGQVFRYLSDSGQNAADSGQEDEIFRLSLLGEYQLHNAATVLAVVDALRGRGWGIPAEAVHRGLADVKWPARFEVLSRRPLFILDGGHNPQCAQALAKSLEDYLPRTAVKTENDQSRTPVKTQKDRQQAGGRKAVFLMGMLADKDHASVIGIIAPFAAGFVCLTPESPRALPAEVLASELQERGFSAKACRNAQEGIETALEWAHECGGLPVVSFGSLYMAGAVRSAFSSVLNKYLISLKKKQRAEALERRRSLTDLERAQKSAAICRTLAALPQLQGADTVFTYAASWDEADPAEINSALAKAGKTVCYPVTGDEGRMTAVIPGQGEDAWRKGPFGIREPAPEKAQQLDPSEIDAVIVPCVVFDRKGGRCGHGAGYYDRFLAALAPDVTKILIAFDAQETSEVAMEKTDVPMDLIVTESGVR